MDDIDIELFDDDDNLIDNTDFISVLPSNFITVGEIEMDSIKIYIKQDVYKRIEKFAKEDISKEVGSILLGEYEEETKSLIISAYIEAKFTDASASTLTFTHKTWDYIYKEKEKTIPIKLLSAGSIRIPDTEYSCLIMIHLFRKTSLILIGKWLMSLTL